jgi:hypothetical protein
MQFKCITETNEVLPNIAEERMKVLLAKTDNIEKECSLLEEEKFYLNLGIPRKYDNQEAIDKRVKECLVMLNKIVEEVRFLNYSVQFGMSVSLN